MIDGEVAVNESLLTGESDDIVKKTGDELFSAIRRISMLHGKVYVEAYADGDTYSSGPVHIKLRITQMTDTGKLIKSN